MSRCIQSGGIDQLQLKASLPTAESTVGKDKSWPLREQLKKASENTQQALARGLNLPSLKLSEKKSPGGRKSGLSPICKCAVWGARRGREKSHTQALWTQRKPTYTPPATPNPYKVQELGAWLNLTMLTGIGREVYCRWPQTELPLSVISLPWAIFRKQKAFICSEAPQVKLK